MKPQFAVFMLLLVLQRSATALGVGDLTSSSVTSVRCPSIGDDYSQMIGKLNTLKATIKLDNGCKGVGETVDAQVDDITKSRQQFLQLIQKAETDSLDATDAAFVSSYLEGLSGHVTSFLHLIQDSKQCFQSGSRAQAFSSLTSLISEGASLIARVSGPWGTTLAIGGAAVANVINAVHLLVEAESSYDFSDRSQWIAYVQNVCTYYSLHGEADALLHPQVRFQQLQGVAAKLASNQQTLQRECVECSTLADVESTKDPRVQSINAAHGADLGSLSVRIDHAQKWVKTELSRVETEASLLDNSLGKTVVAQADRDIGDFLVAKLAPKFLDYQMTMSSRGFNDLTNYLFWQASDLAQNAFKAGLLAVAPPIDTGPIDFTGFSMPMPTTHETEVYLAITATDWRQKYHDTHRPDDDLEYRLSDARREARSKFDNAAWSFGAADLFCQFLRDADFFSPAIAGTCESGRFKELGGRVAENLGGKSPSWKASTPRIRAANWTTTLDLWSDQVQGAIGATK